MKRLVIAMLALVVLMIATTTYAQWDVKIYAGADSVQKLYNKKSLDFILGDMNYHIDNFRNLNPHRDGDIILDNIHTTYVAALLHYGLQKSNIAPRDNIYECENDVRIAAMMSTTLKVMSQIQKTLQKTLEEEKKNNEERKEISDPRH